MHDKKDKGSVPGNIMRAWEIVLGARMAVSRRLRPPSSGPEREVRLKGTVDALGHITARQGPW
jgi:hypothetical protein